MEENNNYGQQNDYGQQPYPQQAQYQQNYQQPFSQGQYPQPNPYQQGQYQQGQYSQEQNMWQQPEPQNYGYAENLQGKQWVDPLRNAAPPEPPKKSSKKGLIIGIVVFLVLAGLGVGAYFLFFHKSGNTTEDLTEAEKVAKEYYIAWTNFDEDGMKKCFDGSVTITDHTQEDKYMETGYWITYGKDANVHAWADYSEPNEGLSGDHTVYCTIEADITGQGDPARSPDTGKVKSETFAMILKNGKWYIAKNEQPKMKETWTDYGTGKSTEENTEASTLAPDITPEETDIESAQAIYNAVNTMMADEEMFIKVNEYAGSDGPVLYLSCIAGEPFGSKSEINVGGVASEVNKHLGGPTRSIYGIYKDGIIPTGWGVVYDPVTAKNRVYAVTGSINNGYKGIQLAPEQGTNWETLSFNNGSVEPDTTESTEKTSSLTPEEILAEISQNDVSSKTADIKMSMKMAMTASYQGQNMETSVDVGMNIKGNRDVAYMEMLMNTNGSSSVPSSNMEIKYWVDNTNDGKTVVYLNNGGVWYKAGAESAPNINVGTYTQYNYSAFKNLTVSETETDWILVGEIDTSQINSNGINGMTGKLKNMPSTMPVTITVDKEKKYVKTAEFILSDLSMESNGITFDVNKYVIRVDVNGYTDEALTVPSDVISSAVDMGDDF